LVIRFNFSNFGSLKSTETMLLLSERLNERQQISAISAR